MPLDWNPGATYQAILDHSNRLLAEEPRTVRDVYYAHESHGREYDYRQVKRALKLALGNRYFATCAEIRSAVWPALETISPPGVYQYLCP